MSEEIWKPVPSFPGIMASSFGRVRMPETVKEMPNGGTRVYKTHPTVGYITRASKTAKHVYYALFPRNYGSLKVHRLVCEAFHGPAPFEKAVVIHIDENALNNKPENLRWGTQKENMNSPSFIEYCKGRKGENSPRTKWYKKKLDD